MGKVSRFRRAQIQRRAQQLRQQGQIAGWSVERIVAHMRQELPDVRPLEAWRLSYGWSRPQVIASLAALYRQAGLAMPAVSSSMLCRWEHGQAQPGPEYGEALCRLYQARSDQLGLGTRVRGMGSHGDRMFGGLATFREPPGRDPHVLGNDGNIGAGALSAVRESVQFALEVEGPGGGPLARDQLDQAVQYFALRYSAFPPSMLAAEVHRCRAVVNAMLGHPQSPGARTELRRLGGWLSALLGNLALHRGDYSAANIHLGTAGGLGADVGHHRLTSWALGARSMLDRYQNKPTSALELARGAVELAGTPLHRAQMIAWAELPALAELGRHGEARDAISAAQREMDAAPTSGEPGRFGFDPAELELHLAEAELAIGNATAAGVHAQASVAHCSPGRPGWAAATLTLARAEIDSRRPESGAQLALDVLDSIPATMLRETSRQRLGVVDQRLSKLLRPGMVAVDLHERVRTLPSLGPIETSSN